MKRREFITLLGGAAAAWPLAARAQQSARLPTIGFLGAPTPSAWRHYVPAFVRRLNELGWIEGRTAAIEYRWAEGRTERFTEIANEFARLKVDVIVTSGTTVGAVKQVTSVIPIVFAVVTDPLGRGFVSNMARPGGNVTGFLNFEFSMGGKWLETLKQIAPAVKRAALLFNPDTAPFAGSFVRVIEDAAPSFGIEPIATVAHDDGELERNVAGFAAKPAGGLIILPDSFTTGHRDLIVALAARYRLPAVYPLRVFAASGGLISDGVDPTDIFRRAASYVRPDPEGH
jgi:putative ABC transport system substrate-binding protein